MIPGYVMSVCFLDNLTISHIDCSYAKILREMFHQQIIEWQNELGWRGLLEHSSAVVLPWGCEEFLFQQRNFFHTCMTFYILKDCSHIWEGCHNHTPKIVLCFLSREMILSGSVNIAIIAIKPTAVFAEEVS